MKNPFSALFGRTAPVVRESSPAPAASSSSAETSSAPRRGATSLLSVYTGGRALGVSTVYCCVNTIANTIASLPLQYLKRDRSGVLNPEPGRMSYLLGLQPHPDYNISDFLAQAVRLVLMEGNAYIVPVWDLVEIGEVNSFVLCGPKTVSYDSLNRRYWVCDSLNGINGWYPENEIIVLRGMSLDGRTGVSVLDFARQTMSIQATGDSETLNRFANGGNVRGIISNDSSVRGFGEYADSELKKTAEDIDGRFQSGERIVNLPGEAKFTQLSLSSVDLEFLQSRKFGVREICRFFGVPPTYVFDDSSSNYKSAEMASIAFLNQTINPMLVRFEQEFERKLIAPHRYGKFGIRFDRRALYAADLQTRADYQTKTIQSGVYTINDWRRFENKPEVEGGDRPLVSANLKSLDELLNPIPTNNGHE